MFEDLAYPFIPFFFTLAIAYGALQISELFKNKAANMLIALVVGFFAASQPDIVAFVYAILGPAVIFFIIFFFIGFLYKFFKKKGPTDFTIAVIILGLILLLLASGLNGNPLVPVGELLSENMVVLLGLVFILAMFYASYRQKTEGG
jgi:phosphate starvation-inducible membrane PsiE